MKNKGTSEKRGISLIVLVITIIVIIILAVAVILSIANNNPIENAKEARFRNDMKVIEEELNLYIAKKYADDLGTNTGVVDLSGEEMVKALPSTKDYKDKVKIVGGNLELTDSASKEERDWAEKIGIKVEETVTLKLGDEVTYQNEPFYIIGGDTAGTEISNSTQDILLLAKYNLKEENGNLKQDTNGAINGCSLCSSTAWNSANVKGYVELNEEEAIRSESTSAVGKAIAYGRELSGATGRLMTYNEAQTLNSEILCGKYTTDGLDYWLSTTCVADDGDYVWLVSNSFGGLFTGIWHGHELGVRPVIEVPKSLIK